MNKFELTSAYKPTGDQPEAIAEPVSYTHLDVYKRQEEWYPPGSTVYLQRQQRIPQSIHLSD